MLAGARLSLLIGFGAGLIAVVLGVILGMAAGYAGGLIDEGLMRVVEIFQIVPRFFLALVVLTIWSYDVWILIAVMGLTSWSGLARLARAETLTAREEDYVQASRASGAGTLRVLMGHVLPRAARPVLAAVPLVASSAMLTEAGLSFLGLGSLDAVSWGYLLNNAQPFLREAWWMALFPGLAMTLAVLVLALSTITVGTDVNAQVRAARW